MYSAKLIAIACAVACGSPTVKPVPASASQLRMIATMLAVRDVARSVAFYRDVLGFEVRFARSEIALLTGAGMELYLTAESPPTPDKPGVTLAPPAAGDRTPVNIVFEVRDVRRQYEEFKRRGLVFLSEPQAPPWGGLRCFARDPDGYLIEIEQPPPAPAAD